MDYCFLSMVIVISRVCGIFPCLFNISIRHRVFHGGWNIKLAVRRYLAELFTDDQSRICEPSLCSSFLFTWRARDTCFYGIRARNCSCFRSRWIMLAAIPRVLFLLYYKALVPNAFRIMEKLVTCNERFAGIDFNLFYVTFIKDTGLPFIMQ